MYEFHYQKLREMRNAGATYDEIGREFGITPARACQICKGETSADTKETVISNCQYPAIKKFYAEHPQASLNYICEIAEENGYYLSKSHLRRVIQNQDVAIPISEFKAWEFVFNMNISDIFKY